ncbi:MAG: hypothetical protein PWQ50_49 [Methanolobus sp.]|jgi:hypothetical protein|nr:hypothetical protein [Methanolobus sp.]
MLNPEKSTQSILKKFETLDEFEKGKIVFWYDKDGTADEEGLLQIKQTLLEKDAWLREAVMQARDIDTDQMEA